MLGGTERPGGLRCAGCKRRERKPVGVVHATVVVNGHVYFGTETTPTFYKLTPDGKVRWTYRNPDHAKRNPFTAFGLPAAVPAAVVLLLLALVVFLIIRFLQSTPAR